MSITGEVQVNMVHKDQFLDLKNETGQLLHEMKKVLEFKEMTE